tara:strand:+ start:28 stop:1773 length:1746 start_codon:yes stop_codon:yes gene_type:complete
MSNEKNSKTNLLTGGMVISKVLKNFGIKTTFALAGASHTFLLDALDKDNFKIVLSRHETGTVGAADGYARATRKVGVALIVSDQGIPNAITGILTAYEACSPVIIISVRRLTNSVEPQTLIDQEKLDLVAPITKWSRTVYSLDRLEEYLYAAYRRALTGRPGPVILQVPQEFLRSAVEKNSEIKKQQIIIPKPGPAQDAVITASKLLNDAKKPLIIVGSGAYWSNSGAELRKLSSEYSIPVFSNAMGRGLVPEDDQLSWSWAKAKSAARFADLILLVGARMTQRLGYGLPPMLNKKAKIIQIDIEGEQISRNRKVDLPVVSDAKLALIEILKNLQFLKTKRKKDTTWINLALEEQQIFINSVGINEDKYIHPYSIARYINKVMPENAIYIGDGADIQNWMHAFLQIKCEGGFMDHYPLGSMGIGTPLAIGVASAAQEISSENGSELRPVVHVTGDGAFGFYSSEYNAAVKLNLKITTLISNDGAWGTEKHGQKITIGKEVNTTFGDINYSLIGKAFGCAADQVKDRKDLNDSIDKGLGHDGPYILDIITDPEAGALRKLDSRVQTVQFYDLQKGQELQEKD